MDNFDELFEACKDDKKYREWLDKNFPPENRSIDGIVHECGGYTIRKTKDGYKHQNGRPVTSFQKWWYGLE